MEQFDGVMVCNGHYAEPDIPSFEGESIFRGRRLHAIDYRTPADFEGKRVVVVGLGNSSADIAVELSRVCSQVGEWAETIFYIMGRFQIS